MTCPKCGGNLRVNTDRREQSKEILVYCSMSVCPFWFRVTIEDAIEALFSIYKRGEAIT